jgi:hypothetical protein
MKRKILLRTLEQRFLHRTCRSCFLNRLNHQGHILDFILFFVAFWKKQKSSQDRGFGGQNGNPNRYRRGQVDVRARDCLPELARRTTVGKTSKEPTALGGGCGTS